MNPEQAPTQPQQSPTSPTTLPVQPAGPATSPNGHYMAPGAGTPAPEGDKDFLTAVLLSYFLGILGVDRFYMGYVGLGILKLVTIGGCGIWALIDLILIFTGNLKDAKGFALHGRQAHLKLAMIIVAIAFGLSAVSSFAYRLTMNTNNTNTPYSSSNSYSY